MAKKWQARIPYEGHAYIAIEKETKPSIDEFRRLMHMGYLDEGLPKFYAVEAEIEEVRDDLYTHTQERMYRKQKKSVPQTTPQSSKSFKPEQVTEETSVEELVPEELTADKILDMWNKKQITREKMEELMNVIKRGALIDLRQPLFPGKKPGESFTEIRKQTEKEWGETLSNALQHFEVLDLEKGKELLKDLASEFFTEKHELRRAAYIAQQLDEIETKNDLLEYVWNMVMVSLYGLAMGRPKREKAYPGLWRPPSEKIPENIEEGGSKWLREKEEIKRKMREEKGKGLLSQVIQQLTKLSDSLDQKGLYQEADAIDKVVSGMLDKESCPTCLKHNPKKKEKKAAQEVTPEALKDWEKASEIIKRATSLDVAPYVSETKPIELEPNLLEDFFVFKSAATPFAFATNGRGMTSLKIIEGSEIKGKDSLLKEMEQAFPGIYIEG